MLKIDEPTLQMSFMVNNSPFAGRDGDPITARKLSARLLRENGQPEQAKEMASLSDGVIVGSAIVKIVAKYGEDCVPYVAEYVKKMKAAVEEAGK